MKKILVVDDSALMRRVLCDIINSDNRFEVQDRAVKGIELLKELNKRKISAKVMMASTDTREGAKTTLDALELGALDFVHKPNNAMDCRNEVFKDEMLSILAVVADSRAPVFGKTFSMEEVKTSKKVVELVSRHTSSVSGNKVVALASSTGGPKALQSVIPRLPKNLKAPVVVVQHMPAGFTASLAERLDSLSEIRVKEAAEGDTLEAGTVYIAKGGKHLNVQSSMGKYTIHYTDQPNREGVKPCANYMYESLQDSRFDQVVCVVMTGMGADGTEGIKRLKTKKKIHVIAQEASTCAVYGMPKSVVTAGLSDQIVPLDQIAQEIIMNVGVK